MAGGNARIRAGVDIGGTFTDVALEHPGGLSSCKVLTDHARPERAIVEGIGRAAASVGVAPGEIGQVIHGTTLVANALIERRGARLAFVTTEGFRDVVEMRNENRFEQYDLNLELPKPLVGRADRLTVPERVAADGSVLLPLDDAAVERTVARILAGGYESVAIGFLHAYANGAHEQRMAEALGRAAPGLPVSISSVIAPQMREFERFNTVIANAYVRPRVAAYLNRLVAELRESGVEAPVLMMHSGGGLISVETAAEQPVRLLESGPAGGAIYAADFARAHALPRILSFDMGGTTAKICLVEDGEPKAANRFEVARTYRFKKGSGMPVSTPVVEMVEIGAGGGSIASVDAMGQIRVGPASAGSEPGPACYGRGGAEPTVTDANLLLGRLDPARFAGGAIALLPDAAEATVTGRLAEAIGLPVAEAAFGVTEIVDENMANAARVHAVENGRDIGAFTLIGFGGGAPLHACRLCEKLGIDTLLIPPGAGVGSAIGFLKAPISFEVSRGHFQRLADFDPEGVNVVLTGMEAQARAFVAVGAGGADTTTRLTAFMRYAGQGWEIPVTLRYRPFTVADLPELRTAFEAAYRTLFGRTIGGLAVEITNWSLAVATALPPTRKIARRAADRAAPEGRTRRFFDAALRRTVLAREVERVALASGVFVEGPAAIVEDETTTLVTSAFRAVGQEDGSLLLTRKGTGA